MYGLIDGSDPDSKLFILQYLYVPKSLKNLDILFKL